MPGWLSQVAAFRLTVEGEPAALPLEISLCILVKDCPMDSEMGPSPGVGKGCGAASAKVGQITICCVVEAIAPVEVSARTAMAYVPPCGYLCCNSISSSFSRHDRAA